MLKNYFAGLLCIAVLWNSFLSRLPAQEAGQQASERVGELKLYEGFEEAGKPGERPKGWFMPTKGVGFEIVGEGAAVGSQALRIAPEPGQESQLGNLLRQLPAAGLAGQRVSLTAKLKVIDKGRAQMWLRADRSNGEPGAFDNMADRPVFPGDWQDVKIELDIEADAAALMFGFISFGGATTLVDELEIRVLGAAVPVVLQPASAPAAVSPRGLENLAAAARAFSLVRFFVASDQAVKVASWDHVAVELMEQAEPAKDPVELAAVIERVLQPLAPTLQVWPGKIEDHREGPLPLPPDAPPSAVRYWRHLGAGQLQKAGIGGQVYSSKVESARLNGVPDEQAYKASFRVKDLGGGVCCRVPVQVYADERGTIPHGDTPERWSSEKGLVKLNPLNRTTRLAGIALAWGVFQHFYPYFDVVQTDWNRVLLRGLAKAGEDADELAYLETLQELVAQLHDGHGNVVRQDLFPKSLFPLLVDWAGSDLVVVGKLPGVPEGIKVGDVVQSIEGRTSAECYAEMSRTVSAATDGWRRSQSQEWFLAVLKTTETPTVTLRRPGNDGTLGEPYTVQLTRATRIPKDADARVRPKDGSEVAPGIVYVDLEAKDASALNSLKAQLEGAKGIVFDVRGYPGEAAYEVIQHLIQEPVQSAYWKTPIVEQPDREDWQWSESGRWQVLPLTPRWRMPVAFLTDGRAISYAESIMGIIEHHQLGEIVGAPTAGTNGNVNPFFIPGNYAITWTGMQVVKHDGSQHHGVGIQPTVPVTPTARGIAAGRDEVLEKAIEVLQKKIK